jgi:hypothetical protein
MFAMTGLAFSLGYGHDICVDGAWVTVFSGAVDIAQLFASGRDARLSDFILDALGARFVMTLARCCHQVFDDWNKSGPRRESPVRPRNWGPLGARIVRTEKSLTIEPFHSFFAVSIWPFFNSHALSKSAGLPKRRSQVAGHQADKHYVTQILLWLREYWTE